ncbi:Sir2-like protein [Escherichia phage nepoznato]|uniref:Sir2-like protein n=1 Tax=Escherichia phage nepoznato TaxID=2696431 RepID=A0A6B9WIQ0_9CAUD|nr:Sir2 (NAD-dependent deacetylase) [Escherichia phage nepoznato]QHR65533.1 Sir2-like protein [Escherichia phage nepoznato]
MPRRVIFITGAGLSVDSGIPAFRTDTSSGEALWSSYNLSEVCDIFNFRDGYQQEQGILDAMGGLDAEGYNLYRKTHDFYNKRRAELEKVDPNPAHLQIGEWFKKHGAEKIINITTNVDDLLERAGVDREEVLHVHGFLPEITFQRKAGQPTIVKDVGYQAIDVDDYHYVKPNVIFFGEAAPLYTDMYHIFDTLTAQDMVIVVGCSNQVINFNWELFPALNIGVKMVVVNPGLNFVEQTLYEERGVLVYREKAGTVFSDEGFIKMVEDHLNK